MPIMASEHAVDARIARNECVNAVEFRRLHQSSERREEKCAPDSAVKRVNSNSVCRINANCLMCSGPRGLEELLDIFGHCIQDEVNTASPGRRSDTSTSRLPGGSLQSRGARRCFLYKKRRSGGLVQECRNQVAIRSPSSSTSSMDLTTRSPRGKREAWSVRKSLE